MLSRDWKALVALPWIATPPAKAHRRLRAGVFASLGVSRRQVALVDQEALMLVLVRSGVGCSLVRKSIAISEVQGLMVVDRASLDCLRCFVCLRARRGEPVVGSAWEALRQVWRRESDWRRRPSKQLLGVFCVAGGLLR